MALHKKVITDYDIEALIEGLAAEEALALRDHIVAIEDSLERNAIIHYRPHSKQRAFDALMLVCNELFFFGGNGTGKSIHGAKTTACYLMGEDTSGTTDNALYPEPYRMHTGRKVYTQGYFGCTRIDKGLRIINQDLIPLLPEGFVVKKPSINDPYLETKLGTGLTIMSYKSDDEQWQSDSLDFIWFDEQPPEAKYEEGKSRVLRRNGRIWCTMTPIYAKASWTYWKIVRNRGKNPNVGYVTADLEDNEYLPRKTKELFYKAYRGTKHEAGRLHGQHSLLLGVIHGEKWDPDIHVVGMEAFGIESLAPVDEKTKKKFKLARVMDLHPRNPSVCQWFLYRKTPEPLIIQIKELAMENTHVKIFGERVKKITADMGMIPSVTIIDTPDSKDETQAGTSLRMELSKVREEGKPMAGIPANRSLTAGIERFDEYLTGKRFFVLENDTDEMQNVQEDTIFSIENFRWDDWRGPNADERTPKEKPVDMHTHWVRNLHYMSLFMPALGICVSDIDTKRDISHNGGMNYRTLGRSVCRQDESG